MMLTSDPSGLKILRSLVGHFSYGSSKIVRSSSIAADFGTQIKATDPANTQRSQIYIIPTNSTGTNNRRVKNIEGTGPNDVL